MWWRESPVTFFHDYGVHLPSRTMYLELDDHEDGAYVGSKAASRAIKNLYLLNQMSHDPIEILMNCSGGNDLDGMAIYEAIRASESDVVITVYGEASSMGSVILQAAHYRQMYSTGRLLLHDGASSGGPKSIKIRDLEKMVEEEKRRRLQMYAIFAERSGKPKAYFRRKLVNDWFLTPEQALEDNLIDRVIEL